MAPVGSFAALTAAIESGCDSIFFGVEQLNMRARSAHNFTLGELEEVSRMCRESNIRSYITMNVLLYEHDMNLMKMIIDTAKEVGITAVICQDMAAIQYASEVGMHIHASTQLSISNYESVKFYARFCDTIVLARELDLNMIEGICNKIKEEDLRGPSGELIKIECFIHGALCVAQSGRCQMSIITTNTSAQRGACLQECRKKYRIIEEETGNELVVDNQYVMSPKDLCCLPFLDKLVSAGINIFKIEGRGRSPQYVDVVIRVYREAVDAIAENSFTQEKIDAWMERLKTVYNRGFSDGYYLGKPLPDWCGDSGSKSTEERVFVGIVNHYFPQAGVAELRIQAHELSLEDRLVVIGKTTGVVYADVAEIRREGDIIEVSERSDMITMPIADQVRKNDKVYILKQRT